MTAKKALIPASASDMREWLEMHTSAAKLWESRNVEAWLHSRGVFHHSPNWAETLVKLKPSQVFEKSQMCYQNAWRYIQRRKYMGLLYCEGLLWLPGLPIPVWHGWVRNVDLKIIDPSVAFEEATISVYFGVCFRRYEAEDAWKKLNKLRAIGILQHTPELRLRRSDLDEAIW